MLKFPGTVYYKQTSVDANPGNEKSDTHLGLIVQQTQETKLHIPSCTSRLLFSHVRAEARAQGETDFRQDCPTQGTPLSPRNAAYLTPAVPALPRNLHFD